MIYYLYSHTRLDTNEVFYIGIGRTYKVNVFTRAYSKHRKSHKAWEKVIKECNENYRVDIISIFDNSQDCCKAEDYFIKCYGQVHKKTGSLVNIKKGGHVWKTYTKIYEYDLEGNYKRSWSSASEAAKALNLKPSNIYGCSNREGRVKNYMFRYYKLLKITKYTNKTYKKIYAFNKYCNYLSSHKTIQEAADYYKVKAEHISDVLHKRAYSLNGIIYSFQRHDNKPKRIIEQYDKYNNLIAKYLTLKEAVDALNKNSFNSIDNALKGKQKTAYGFIWKDIRNN